MIGIQLDTESWTQYKPDRLCATLQEQAAVDSLFCFYSDEHLRHGPVSGPGCSAQAPAPALLDDNDCAALDRLQVAAEAHGMHVYLSGGERSWCDCRAVCPDVCQIDCFGEARPSSCVNHPGWRALQMAEHADLFQHNEFLAGFMFMHERAGPFLQVFKPEPWQGVFNPGCFCQHCRALGAERGIDVDEARTGFRELVRLFRDRDPALRRDGVMVGLWRLFSRYPATLAWERLQWDSLFSYRAAVADAIRDVRPGLTIGHHFQHGGMNADLPWRAGEDPVAAAAYADWLKPSVYPGCSGKRYKDLLDRYRETWLADLDPDCAHQVISAWFGRDVADGAPMLTGAQQVSFGADWVRDELRRIIAAAGDIPVYAGLGIGIPGGEQADSIESITACTHACLDAGCDGFLLSRHYSEMPDAHLRAAGAVIREGSKRQRAAI